jgi:hypothetical protein
MAKAKKKAAKKSSAPREGSMKAKLLASLPKGKAIKINTLLTKLYGNAKDENRPAFNIRVADANKSVGGKIERNTEADTLTLR